MFKDFFKVPSRRIAYRFVEIFVVGGLSALALAPEFNEQIVAVFGTAIAAAFTKTLREYLVSKKK